MGIIQEIFNFDNIGEKIKNWAKWSCWITILLTWVCAIICFFILLFTEGTFWVAFLVPIAASLYSLLIWIGSWATYAFGEYIEDTKAIRYNTAVIAQPIRNTEATKTQQNIPQKPTPLKTIKTVTDPIIPARTDKPSKKTVGEGEYVSGRTYTKGDSVIFEDKKYICVGSSTVWSPGIAPSQWQEISSDEVR